MEESKVYISVIVPVYNCVQWLQECIESVLNQTFREFELILVDDGSTDGSAEICDKYAEKYVQVKVFHKENGGGAGEARNYGLRVSRGEFIVFLDSDDCQHPELLQNLYDAQKKKDYDLVICGYQFLDDHDQTGEEFCLKAEDIIGRENIIDYFISYYPDGLLGYPWNKLYRRSIIEENEIVFPKMRRLEDGIFNVAYFQNIGKLCILEQPLVNYQVNSQVLLRKLPYDFYENMKIFSKNYYSFLKRNHKNRKDNERPFVIYFLNDFVCCLENILANNWPDKSYGEHKAYIKELRHEKLVRYMLKDTTCVPRYSRLILKLFKDQNILLLRAIIRIKLWMKSHLKKIFAILKKKVN